MPVLKRASDKWNVFGACVGSAMVAAGLWEHSVRPVDDHYTLSVLVLGGTLINPFAIINLIAMLRRQKQ